MGSTLCWGVAADAVQAVLQQGLTSALLRAARRALLLFYSSGEREEVCSAGSCKAALMFACFFADNFFHQLMFANLFLPVGLSFMQVALT